MNRPTPNQLRVVVMSLAVLWCIVQIAVPGRFPHTDDAYFKDPGYALRETGKLASPALEGYQYLTPDLSEIFAVYQPLYPLAYCAWLGAFPHSFRSAVAFDCLIRLALVATILFALPRLLPGVSDWAVAGVGVAALLLGTPARPDELAMVLGYWGLAAWLGHAGAGWGAILCGGALLGLCGCTSGPVFIVLMVWAGVVWLWRTLRAGTFGGSLLRATGTGIVCVCVLLCVLVPFYLRPGAWQQYREISQHHFFAGITKSIRLRDAGVYVGMLQSTLRSSRFQIPLYLFVVLASAVRVCVDRRGRMTPVLAGGLVAYAFILLALPQQYLYFWFPLPILMAAVASGTGRVPIRALATAALVLVAANSNVRELVKACQVRGDQSPRAASGQLIRLIPLDARVFASAKSYFLLRDHCAHVTLDHWLNWDVIKRADYCVFGGWLIRDCDRLFLPRDLDTDEARGYFRSHFDLIHNGLPRGLPRLFGLPIGSEPIGYGVVVYRRKTSASAGGVPRG